MVRNEAHIRSFLAATPAQSCRCQQHPVSSRHNSTRCGSWLAGTRSGCRAAGRRRMWGPTTEKRDHHRHHRRPWRDSAVGAFVHGVLVRRTSCAPEAKAVAPVVGSLPRPSSLRRQFGETCIMGEQSTVFGNQDTFGRRESGQDAQMYERRAC